MRPELLAQNPLCIASNQRTFVINFHQDFVAGMHNNFTQRQTDRGIIYWPYHFGKLGFTNKKK